MRNCATGSKAEHDNLVATRRDLSPLLGVNIVGQLERDYPREDDLKSFMHDLVKQAGNFLEFSKVEVDRGGDGIPTEVPTKVTTFMIIIPKAQEHATFAATPKTVIHEQAKTDGKSVAFIESDHKLNEITFIDITNLFPPYDMSKH